MSLSKKLVNQSTGYYIATYSAHASILENLLGKNGKMKKLLVDGGGLKANFGTFEDPKVFDNYVPVTDKTLHAKVIYLEKTRVLSLWSGNLRKHTLKDQDNIFITKIISQLHAKKIIDWFNGQYKANHLFVHFLGNSIKNIESKNSNTVWSVLENQIKRISATQLAVHAFSPWGSYTVIKKLLLSNRSIKSLYLYTRNEPDENDCWLYNDFESIREDVEVKRFMRDDKMPFPHFKAIFITQKLPGTVVKIAFAYIGSANLTQAAITKKDNIEFAALYKTINQGDEIYAIFKRLSNPATWLQREKRQNRKQTDESRKVDDSDYASTDNFEIRQITKKIIKKYDSCSKQKELENAYEEGKTIPFNSKKEMQIRVDSISDNMFDLLVDPDNWCFNVQIIRKTSGNVLSEKDIDHSFNMLLQPVNTGPDINEREGSGIDTEQHGKIIKHANLKFPIFDYLKNPHELERKKKLIQKLNGVKNRMNEEQNKIFTIWAQVISKI